MAIIIEENLNANNMERVSATTSKHFDGATGYAQDDIVILGLMPRECVVTDIRILFLEQVDATFDLGFIDDWDAGNPSFTFRELATDITSSNNRTTVIPMPTLGVRNPDGSAYTGDRGSIWCGERGHTLAIRCSGGAISAGKADIVVEYNYYGTKNGKYGLDPVPLSVYTRG